MTRFYKPRPGERLNPNHPRARGLIGWWPFAERGGTSIADYSLRGHHGVFQNKGSRSDWIPTKYGRQLFFDGVDDSVFLGNWDIYSDTGLTICATVVYPSTLQPENYPRFFSQSDSSSSSRHNAMLGAATPNGRIIRSRIKVQDQSTTTTLGNTTLPATGGRFHVATTYDPIQPAVRIFIDAVEDALNTSTFSGPIETGTNRPIRIGAQGEDSVYFFGQIEDIRLYNRPLSVEELEWIIDDPYAELEQPEIRSYFLFQPVAQDIEIIGDVPWTLGVAAQLQIDQSLLGDVPWTLGVAAVFEVEAEITITGDVPWSWGVAGAFALDQALTGDVPWSWGVAGAFALDQSLVGDVPWSWGVAGAFALDQALTGDVPWSWGVAGAFGIDQALVGDVPWTLGVAAVLDVDVDITLLGDVPWSWGVAGAFALDQALVGDVPWLFDVNGAFALDQSLTGDVPWILGVQAIFSEQIIGTGSKERCFDLKTDSRRFDIGDSRRIFDL